MAHTTEGSTECVEAVKFGILSDEEVRKQSCMRITNPTLFDQLDTPKPGGLYDPALGPLDEVTPCRSCGLRSRVCPGHCGHIDLVLPVYNPLLFKNLFNLLQKSCFFCHHFKDNVELVERCSSQLELIIKGDIVGAKNLDSPSPDEPLSSRENDSINVNDATCHSRTHEFETKHIEQHSWTSIQHGEAMSLLDTFMKRKKKSCERCEAKSPTITCPTFGWIYMDMPNKRARENAILGSKLMQPSLGENILDSDDVESSGAVYDEMSASVTKKGKKNERSLPAEFLKQTKLLSGPLLPTEAKHHIELLWQNENRLCSLISNIQQDGLCAPENRGSYSMFFIEALVVPPIKFRPPSKGGTSVMEHPQTALLSQVLQCNLSLGNAHMNKSQHSWVVRRWMDLQLSVNVLFGNKRSASQRDNIGIGVCQLLEKKEGIFRQKLMGKRVNHACRSVISPDPYLAVNEIGIPPYFALRLTYPERVTPWNVTKLRNAIINGPEVHPGATLYVDKFGTTKLAPGRKSRNSISRKLPSSRGVVVQPGKSLEHELEGKVVHRHLQDGDVVLVNRQPTLHKPSIMAHVVRVLKGEKTIRMHYANCSTYNADFDGDEMNVHFPQDEISRAEALNIVNADNQYIIPTSGDTKRGLIQDHIVSAVLLTKRDTFLTWEEYDHLLCASGVNAAARVGSIRKYGQKVSLLNTADEIQYLEPAILKPVPLWTGKQVITSILNHLTRIRGLRPFTIKKQSTIRKEYFGRQSGEGKFFVLNNYLVHGVIDKSQFGKYGLVHTIQELYGSHTAGVLLSTLSRLFTIFLQMHGFTCGVDDLLIVKSLDKERRKIFERRVGEQVHAEFLGYKEDLDVRTLQEEIEKVMRVNGEAATARLDKMMSGRNAKLTNEVNDKLFPSNSSPIGLLKPFPRNCFFLMTASGAKGSQVNFQQISSLLGQQELEGKRVPRMISGKTLPCFPPWDPSSRAGGFISDRYLTGLRPQEYYFHCMAGREGLVDTAVKTSRSGYLQRCLVKSLECLKVCYDHTVRDADGSVVQFCYGEDGIDVHKTSFLSKIKTLVVNQEVVQGRLSDKCENARFANSDDYIKGLPEALKKSANDFMMKFSKKCQMREALMNKLSKEPHSPRLLREPQVISKLMKLKYLSSLAEPGEPVGVIAAQSIGEPSTQMTLNTFHHAGQGGEVNVTLGIPRLQEILMRASENIQTPVMTCPLHRGKTRDDADRLAAKFMKVSVADLVENMEVRVVPFSIHRKKACTLYKLKMKLYRPDLYPRFSDISLKDCHETLEHVFVDELERAIKTHLTMLSKISGIKNFVQINESGDDETDGDLGSKRKQAGQENNENGKGDDGDDDDGGDNDDDGEAEDLGADAQKRKLQARDEMEYEDGIENEASMIEGENIEGEPSGGFESEVDQGDTEISNDVNANVQIHDAEDESGHRLASGAGSKENHKSDYKRKEFQLGVAKKNWDKAVFVEANGLNFEVHLRFTNEPYILLSEIAQKAAKNVYIKRAGNINQCSVVEKDNGYQLQTAGVNFQAFWQMQDELDINQIISNDIHAILRTYGVEAARATLMKQVNAVFEDHGISVNIRHLTLVADFMTQSGQYRPMSRHGMAASISPFSKMSFETAAEFIIKAAYHGEVDYLEAPSARICLGLPVKMGTGCFDLMQKIDI